MVTEIVVAAGAMIAGTIGTIAGGMIGGVMTVTGRGAAAVTMPTLTTPYRSRGGDLL
jgi:hypothetical protein